MNMAAWLAPSPRSNAGLSFDVTDVVDTPPPPSASDLADLLTESYWGNDYLADLADRYELSDIRDKFLRSRAGTRLQVKRGDFGEAVTVDYLKCVEGYLVPVMKLRFKMAANQTLPGTDCIALKVSEETLTEVAFVESKLRTSQDLDVAVEGARQLERDAGDVTPELLVFVARHLRETGNPLADLFEEYVFRRDTDLDRFLLVLLHERDAWDERVLQNLEDDELELTPLHVYVAAISNLRDTCEGAFSAMGAEVLEDGH